MLFSETEKRNKSGHLYGYQYKCVDVFGELLITSKKKLDAEMLDLIAMTALQKTPVGETKGIKWHLNKKNDWEEVAYTAKPNLETKRFSFNLKIIWDFIKKIVNW